MKRLIITSALLCSVFTASAAPLVTIGDQLDIFFTGKVKTQWDSNITYTNANNKVDDYSAIFDLGTELDYGRNSKFKANIKFWEALTRYSQYSHLNSNLANLYANASYEETFLRVKANFSFVQLKQNSSTIIQASDLVRRDQYNGGLVAEYDITEKIYIDAGVKWFMEDFADEWTSTYANQDAVILPISALYRVTEKISAGLTYQFRYTSMSGGRATDRALYGTGRADNFGGVTLRGEIAPKLSTTVYLGVSHRSINGYNQAYHDLIYGSGSETDTLNFTGSISLNYAVTEKISTYLEAFRDYTNGSQYQSSVNTGVELGSTYAFSKYLSAVASFTYSNSEYDMGYDRTDDDIITRVGVNYTPNKFITVGANYRYLNNSSTIESARYNQHLVDLSVSLRY